MNSWFLRLGVAAVCVSAPHFAAAQTQPQPPLQIQLSPEQMLAASSAAQAQGDERTAEGLLRALLNDPRPQVRNEARFRLAMLAISHKNLGQAATLLRAILDEEPGAQRVRLELARVLNLMGDIPGARRELRQAQAGALPPEVARVVNQFSAALRERKPFGGSIDISLAPDSNVNRATRSNTLGTVIGDFVLEDAAKAHSGLGIAIRGTGYGRVPLGNDARLVGQLSVDGSYYGQSEYDDVTIHVGVGPEFDLPKGRLQTQASYQRRWIGKQPYSDMLSVGAVLERPIGSTAQLRLTGLLSRTNVIPNRLQDSMGVLVSGSFEKALSPRSGAAVTVSGGREAAREPAYSNWYGQIGVLGWYELGRTTLIAGANFAPLWSDERMLLYPKARRDQSWRLSLAASLRQFTFNHFAPQLRLTWENSRSTIELYQYSRVRAEIGVVRAF